MVDERRFIDSRFERSPQLAGDWARRLDNALGPVLAPLARLGA